MSKIFLKKNDILLNFMWVTMKDSDVYMGIHGAGKESIKKIFDDKGELLPGKHFKLETYQLEVTQSKISFHKSGRYKLIHKIKKIFSDRITIDGPPLQSIGKPRRMVEIILPKYLLKTCDLPNLEKDLIIDISDFPNKPLRCSISCMHSNELDNFLKSQVINTSIIESSHVFTSDSTCWVWTMRISNDDELASDNEFILVLCGKVIWPSLLKSLSHKIKKFISKFK